MMILSIKQLRLVISALLLLIVSGGMAAANSPAYEIDKGSGLIMAPGWEMVKGNCTACHSAKFVTLQRGDRETWESMLRWMQKTQGLWQFTDEVEKTILDYLAANYPPGKPSRRANLAASLMPVQ